MTSTSTRTLIDAHTHLWRRDRTPQPWIDPTSMVEIDHDFWVSDLETAQATTGSAGAIVVQSANSLSESKDLLAASPSPSILGVVGWVDLEADVAAQVAELHAAPGGELLVGIRHLAHQDADPRWLGRATVGAGLDALGRLNLPFDLVLLPSQLELAADVVAEHGGTRFVLDHLGKPPIASGSLTEWSRAVARVAASHNVVAKLSGLTIEAAWNAWTVEDLRTPVARALDVFGPRRLLFGSDWPLVRLCGGYQAWLAAIRELLSPLSDEDQNAIFARNAAGAYALEASNA